MSKRDDHSRNFKSGFIEMFWLLTSYWGQARERYINIIADIHIKPLGPSKSCWICIIFMVHHIIYSPLGAGGGGSHTVATEALSGKKKFSRKAAGTGTRRNWKQCPVQVICCISGRRVVRTTLTAALKPGSYRNNQAVGKAFMHSSFIAVMC